MRAQSWSFSLRLASSKGDVHRTIGMKMTTRFLGVAVLIAAAISCGDVVREGRSASYLVIDSIEASRGGPSPGIPSSTLVSDVITNGTIYRDLGQVVMR